MQVNTGCGLHCPTAAWGSCNNCSLVATSRKQGTRAVSAAESMSTLGTLLARSRPPARTHSGGLQAARCHAAHALDQSDQICEPHIPISVVTVVTDPKHYSIAQ